jgi:hypothetical protein
MPPRTKTSVIFIKKQMAQFDALRMEIEQAIAQRSNPPASAPLDHLAQLKQLGELRDAGVLSEVEFATKKSEILGRL